MTDGTTANYAGAWYGTRDADIGYQVRLKTAMTTVYGVVNAWSALSGIVQPVGAGAPVLSTQTPKVGKNIASTFGVWKGYVAGVTTYTYEWQACTSRTDAGTCSKVTGAPNSPNWVPSAGQGVAGKYLRVFMTLTTRGQSVSQASAITTSPVVS